MSKKIVIIGAGITGLSAGWKLAQRGYDIVIIEKESRVGGLAASVYKNGYIFDFGPHAFHSQNSYLLSTFYKVMQDRDVVKQKKWVQIKFQKKYFDYPLKPANVFFQLQPSLALKCTSDLLWTRFKNTIQPTPDDSTKSWLINRFGKSIYNIYFGPYTQKVWGIPPDELSPNFIAGRVPTIKISQLISKYIFHNNNFFQKDTNEIPLNLDIYYPAEGASVFPEMMLKQIIHNDGKLFLNSIPKKIIIEKNMVKGIVFMKKERETYIECDYLISTIPITELAKLLHLQTEELRYRAIIIVCLMINKPTVFKPQTIYFTNCIFNRIAQMNNYSQTTVPENRSGITCEIMCSKNDDIWNESEERLCNKVIADLVKEGFVKETDIEGAFILKNKYGYPIMLKGYESNLSSIFEKLQKIENLLTGGRQGLFNYIQMDFALNSGLKMAEHIISNNSKLDLKKHPLILTYFK